MVADKDVKWERSVGMDGSAWGAFIFMHFRPLGNGRIEKYTKIFILFYFHENG